LVGDKLSTVPCWYARAARSSATQRCRRAALGASASLPGGPNLLICSYSGRPPRGRSHQARLSATASPAHPSGSLVRSASALRVASWGMAAPRTTCGYRLSRARGSRACSKSRNGRATVARAFLAGCTTRTAPPRPPSTSETWKKSRRRARRLPQLTTSTRARRALRWQ
jgi:hypothetical protein